MFELSHHMKHFNRCLNAANRHALLSHLIADISLTSKRTTFILKRKFPVKLMRYGETEARLKGKDYVYDLVQDTEVLPKPLLKVVLKQLVEGVGMAGEVVSLPRYKAYNEFLVPGLADYATPDVIAAWEARRRNSPAESSCSSPYAILGFYHVCNTVCRFVISSHTYLPNERIFPPLRRPRMTAGGSLASPTAENLVLLEIIVSALLLVPESILIMR